MKCNHCGHEGTFFPIIEKDKLKKPLSAKETENVKHFDTTFAKGIFRIILLSLTLLFGVVGAVMVSYPETKTMSLLPIIFALVCLAILMKTKTTSLP